MRSETPFQAEHARKQNDICRLPRMTSTTGSTTFIESTWISQQPSFSLLCGCGNTSQRVKIPRPIHEFSSASWVSKSSWAWEHGGCNIGLPWCTNVGTTNLFCPEKHVRKHAWEIRKLQWNSPLQTLLEHLMWRWKGATSGGRVTVLYIFLVFEDAFELCELLVTSKRNQGGWYHVMAYMACSYLFCMHQHIPIKLIVWAIGSLFPALSYGKLQAFLACLL